MRLAAQCDTLARGFAGRSPSGLVAQIERAAGSVAANIAEGAGRRSRPDYLRHLSIADGSLLEVETHVLRAAQIGLIKPSDVNAVLATSEEAGRLIAGLIRWVERPDSEWTRCPNLPASHRSPPPDCEP
jgi:four helix bundle protein